MELNKWSYEREEMEFLFCGIGIGDVDMSDGSL